MRLVLAMVDPPLPFGNAAAREYYALFVALTKRHDVTVFAVCASEEERAQAMELFPSTHYDLRCYLRPVRTSWRAPLETLKRPLSHPFSAELVRDLHRALAAPYDALHLEQTASGWLALEHRRRAVLNVHFLGSLDWARSSLKMTRVWLERRLMMRAEHRLIRAFPNIRTLSPRLAREVSRINPAAAVHTIPLAIDSALYRPTAMAAQDKPVVSLIGSMRWRPNRLAAERFLTELWPDIRRRVPGARAQIVGWDAERELASYRGTPGVVIEQNVSEIRPYFERSSLLLYPQVRGSGMKVKVLEALALGVPVVTTRDGVEGLSAVHGVHAAIADDDAGLVELTVRLLSDAQLRERLRSAGRKLVERVCGAEVVAEQLEELYTRLWADAARGTERRWRS